MSEPRYLAAEEIEQAIRLAGARIGVDRARKLFTAESKTDDRTPAVTAGDWRCDWVADSAEALSRQIIEEHRYQGLTPAERRQPPLEVDPAIFRAARAGDDV